MRSCASLYASFAFESLSSYILFLLFLYLVVVIAVGGYVESPALAALRLVTSILKDSSDQFASNLSLWHLMPHRPLNERFAFCRKLNMSICMFSALVALLAMTRWLHIGNVNGFRYLGYAMTCPLMQGELVVLIAPLVPFYRVSVAMSAMAAFVCIIAGYVSSLHGGPLWEGELLDFIETGDLDDLAPTGKFNWAIASMLSLFFLSFIQIPYLALLYLCKGRKPHAESTAPEVSTMPWHYLRLLLIVSVTWLTFPIWWLISYEGMGVIEDTKLNGFGFCVLNFFSKASFTWQMLKMVKHHKEERLKAGRKVSIVTMDFAAIFLTRILKPYDTRSPDSPSASTEDPMSPRCPEVSFPEGLVVPQPDQEAGTKLADAPERAEGPDGHEKPDHGGRTAEESTDARVAMLLAGRWGTSGMPEHTGDISELGEPEARVRSSNWV